MNKWEKAVALSQLHDEKEALKELERHYRNALKDIETNIRLLSSDELTQSRMYQLQYQKALRGQVQGVLQQLHTNSFTTIQQYIERCYHSGFVGTMYSLAGQGMPVIAPIDNDAIVRAALTNSKLSASLYESLGQDLAALKKMVTGEITRGITRGASWEEIANDIAFSADIPKRRAKTIARTEGHRVQQEAAADARDAAKERGCNVVKQWDSTLDGSTRETHRQLDGQIRESDEPFSIGGKKADYPGGFGDPSEDCNCRCVALTRAKWGLDENELKTMKERASYFGLDKSDSFAEFEKKYLEAAQQKEKKDIQFKPARSIGEAEEFAKQFVDDSMFGAIGVSYKGVGLEVANEINKTLNTFFETFNVKKLGGVAAPAKNTKLGQKISAHVAYSPVRKSILFNRENTKTMNKFVEGLLADKRAVNDILTHPERYDMSKASTRFRNIIMMSEKTGRALVPETAEEAIFHELGHHLENFFTKDDWATIKKRMPDYAEKISGYATDSQSEYIAESFASYMIGENLIDPFVKKIFDGWRK